MKSAPRWRSSLAGSNPSSGVETRRLEFYDEFRRHGQLEIASDRHEAIPAIISVGAVATAAHEGDFAVTELVEMAQGKFGSALLVQDDVRDAFDLAVAGNDDSRENAQDFFRGLYQ